MAGPAEPVRGLALSWRTTQDWEELLAQPLAAQRSLLIRLELTEPFEEPDPDLPLARGRMLELLCGAGLDRVERLELEGFDVQAHELRRLVASPLAARLRSLRVANDFRLVDDLLDVVAASPELERLESLSLTPWLTARAVRALTGTHHLPLLERLELASEAVGSDDVIRLLQARPRLQSLRLKLGLGVRAAEALAAAPELQRLEELALHELRLGEDETARMVAALLPALPRLRRLHLGRNPLRAAAMRTIAAGPRLRRLDLAGCNFREPVGELLLDAPALDEIEHLDLRSNDLGPELTRRLRERYGAAVVTG